VGSDVKTEDLLNPDTLLELYGERIYRLARRMSNSEADAEDVMQNALVKIIRNAASYRGDSDPMGWIYRITMNEAREVHRRRKRKPSISLDALPVDFDETQHAIGVTDFSKRPERTAMAAEVNERVREAIDELPDGYREAVILHDLEGVPYQESAKLLDLTLGGFKTRLHRARLHLRRRLEEFWHSVDEGRESSAPTDGDR
jgi:RNA polymerase sigma-70 factor (ECF subfamily)